MKWFGVKSAKRASISPCWIRFLINKDRLYRRIYPGNQIVCLSALEWKLINNKDGLRKILSLMWFFVNHVSVYKEGMGYY
jgi:hypothetical protein